MADPQLLIALEARLDKFEKQMAEAGLIAERGVKDIESKFQKLQPSFAPTFVGNFLGNIASKIATEIPRIIGDIIERFKELDRVAQITGQSMQQVFGLQQAAGAAGASIAEVNKGLRDLATLLERAGRGEVNTLTQLFEANKISIRDANKELITTQQALEIVSRLVQNTGSQIQKIEVARLAGQAENLVKFLEKGPEHLRATQQAAAAAAPPLDDIKKSAVEFEKVMSDLADRFKAGALDFGKRAIEDLKDAWAGFVIFMGQALELISRFPGFGSLAPKPGEIEQWQQYRLNLTLTTNEYTKLIQAAEAFASRDKGLETPPRAAAGTTKLPDLTPAKNEERDAFDRATDSITKHIAVLNAEKEAVGKSAEETEKLRVAAILLDAAIKAGIPITAQVKDLINEYAERAGQAKGQLEKLTAAQNELNAASREFGSALSEAFKGAVLQGQKLDQVLKNLANRMASRAIDKLFDLLFAPQGGQGTSIFNKLLGLTARQAGGPLSAGQAAVVGERGPELFIPKRSGMVVPNSALRNSGGAVEVKVINNTGQPVAEQERQGPNGRVLEITVGRLVRDTIRNDLFQGGDVDRAMRSRFGLTPRLA